MIKRLLVGAAVVAIAPWAIIRVVRTLKFEVRDKVFLITGGSRGLGLVLAREVCRRGGRVALLARDAEELGRARNELVRRGGDVLIIACDLQKPAEIEAAVTQTINRLGRIDVLINNAGIIQVGPLDHMQR